MRKIKYKTISWLLVIAIIMPNGALKAQSFELRHTLGPVLATKPLCEVVWVKDTDMPMKGYYQVCVTGQDFEKTSSDKTTRQEVIMQLKKLFTGDETLQQEAEDASRDLIGADFKDIWAMVYLSLKAQEIMELARKQDLFSPEYILAGFVDTLSKDIGLISSIQANEISSVTENGKIRAFSFPIMGAQGERVYDLVISSKKGPDPMISIKTAGQNIYVGFENDRETAIISGFASLTHATNSITKITDLLTQLRMYIDFFGNDLIQITGIKKNYVDTADSIIQQAIKCVKKISGLCLEYGAVVEQRDFPEEAVLFQDFMDFKEVYKELCECDKSFEYLRRELSVYMKGKILENYDTTKQAFKGIKELLIDRINYIENKIMNEKFDLKEVIKNVIEHFRKDDAKIGLDDFLIVKTPNTPVWMEGNRISIASVLCNIIANCRKYAKIAHKKDLTKAKVTLNINANGEDCRITIEDNGTGMTGQELKDLWKPFYSTTGGGIGLTESKRIIDMHKGSVVVVSKLGEGTKFVIEVPLKIKTEIKNEFSLCAEQFHDMVKYIAYNKKNEAAKRVQKEEQKTAIIALGTNWIKGYKGREHVQHKYINELLSALRKFCEKNNMVFSAAEDKDLLNFVNSEKEKYPDAKVIILANEDTVKMKELQKIKDVFLGGINNSAIGPDNYMRITDLLNTMVKLAFDLGDAAKIIAESKVPIDPKDGYYLFNLPLEPLIDIEPRAIYDVQIFA
ncbi:MAG: HAMP domain-containing histidine kinase [Candidatus Omnitrophica bacterium]|nr:HAMP domain-containing histidine kinase [Candidatus Omnitrophota bacterium]